MSVIPPHHLHHHDDEDATSRVHLKERTATAAAHDGHPPAAPALTALHTDEILSALNFAEAGSETAMSGYRFDKNVAFLIAQFARTLPISLLCGLFMFEGWVPYVHQAKDPAAMVSHFSYLRQHAHHEHEDSCPIDLCTNEECTSLPLAPGGGDRHRSDDYDALHYATRELIRRCATGMSRYGMKWWRVHACIEGELIHGTTAEDAVLAPPFFVYAGEWKQVRPVIQRLDSEAALRSALINRLARVWSMSGMSLEGVRWEKAELQQLGTVKLVQRVLEDAKHHGNARGWISAVWHSARRLDQTPEEEARDEQQAEADGHRGDVDSDHEEDDDRQDSSDDADLED